MKMYYDNGERTEMEMPSRMHDALVTVLREFAAAMEAEDPAGAWCWKEGRCYVGNMAAAGLTLCWGAKGDFADGHEGFVVLPSTEEEPTP